MGSTAEPACSASVALLAHIVLFSDTAPSLSHGRCGVRGVGFRLVTANVQCPVSHVVL